MTAIARDSVLADVLEQHCELIPIANRFGIFLGVGNKTIDEICSQNGLSSDLIVTVFNVYIDEAYLPKNKLMSFDIEPVVNYFMQTINYYLQNAVPNLEKHLNAFMALSGLKTEELNMIRSLFFQFKSQFTEHVEKGLTYLEDYPHELLNDLKNILIRHISDWYNQNLCYAVIFWIDTLENDLIIHNRLKNKILKPKIKKLDRLDIYDLQQVITHEKKQEKSNASILTGREIEILKLIVRGYINKEIADKLNISLNTVLTHRKHIISKTGIKTVSGLTFYCISNGLLSSDFLSGQNRNNNLK
ncbi:helix-turn-helix domain-containing protein [Anaerorudis cellulosivorans]|uniref:helix-turn-helix domain-containing protein n=1 Tax=Anaerorudis cellulosivorans TaxID=3397862 RepID=UPI00221F7117|nr:helix-turn-helix transcriptional regulator [Seramator thermalis]MCW1735377.1 helix-turn-helix transcriptional regulator [Seramator thermalis]